MDQFIGEIRLLPFSFAPQGWALCQGQLLPIAQNSALFALLGTQYGGNGTSTFALPNLGGNIAVHVGQGAGLSNYYQGQSGGSTTVTLTSSQLPGHTHALPASTVSGTVGAPSPSVALAAGGGRGVGHPFYTATADNPVSMLPSGATGGGQAHNNMSPYLVLNYAIALQGIFPSRP